MIYNGQDANQTNFNNAFPSKMANNTLAGVLTLNNSSSGEKITNLQKVINRLLFVLGTTEDAVSTNEYESQNYITSNDGRLEAISKLDAALYALSLNVGALANPSFNQKTLALEDAATITLDSKIGLQRFLVSGNNAAVTLALAPFASSFEDSVDGILIELIGTDDINTVSLVASDTDYGYIGERGDIVFSRGTVLRLSFDLTTKRFYGV